MTINDRIIAAVSSLAVPIYPNTYMGDADTYMVFNLSAYPHNYADDEPEQNVWWGQLHLFCPHSTDSVAMRKQIKLLLQGAGFTYPTEVDASDEDCQHIVFEFEIAEGISDG